MTIKRFTLAGLMGAVVCALMLVGAPAARAQTAAEESVLLDPFDPVPEIQFRHFGGDDCWEGCGYRRCDGCAYRCYDRCGCHDGCERRCYRDCYRGEHCYRGCHPRGYTDRERRFDHDANRVERDLDIYRDDHERFRDDAHEYERDDRAWHERYDHDGHWDRDHHWIYDGARGPDGHGPDGHGPDGHRDHDGGWDGRGDPNLDAERHEEHVEQRHEEKHEEHREEKREEHHEDKAIEHGDAHDSYDHDGYDQDGYGH